MADTFGLQAARKGVIFESFPPVLHMQLKRFEYDFMRDMNVKINDRYEFPLTIDLRPYMSDPESREPQIYHLHGVLVHAGDTHGGHYCAFLRPEPNGTWFKFDDDRVTRCSPREAIDDNFGADPDPDISMDGAAVPPQQTQTRARFNRRHTNAYMLVYVRERELNDVLCPVDENEIPAELFRRFEEERREEEERKRDRDEQVSLMTVRATSDRTIAMHKGLDLAAEGEEKGAAVVHRVKREMTLGQFKLLLAKEHEVSVERLRVWAVIRRQNASRRPSAPLSAQDDDVALGVIAKRYNLAPELHVYVEVAGEVEKSGWFNTVGRSDVLLFLKGMRRRLGVKGEGREGRRVDVYVWCVCV